MVGESKLVVTSSIRSLVKRERSLVPSAGCQLKLRTKTRHEAVITACRAAVKATDQSSGDGSGVRLRLL